MSDWTGDSWILLDWMARELLGPFCFHLPDLDYRFTPIYPLFYEVVGEMNPGPLCGQQALSQLSHFPSLSMFLSVKWGQTEGTDNYAGDCIFSLAQQTFIS